MIEAPFGHDLWDPGWRPDAIVITTNGDVTRDGRAVMGRGCALEAKQRVRAIDYVLAERLGSKGNHVHVLTRAYNYRPIHEGKCAIVSFPVKHHWRDDADLELIERSAVELRELVDREGWDRITMPRPGCGNGRLHWKTVEPVIASILDDRFVVVHK